VVEQQVSGVEMKLSALRNQANLLNYNNGDDLLQMRSDTRDKLTSDLTTLNENIRGQLGALVEPAQAAELLEQVVAEHRGLKIKSLHASTAPLDDIHLGGSQASGLNQYQLDLELEGGYLDLLRYLQALESMPWKFFWQNVDFRISLHPHAVTRLQVYTLGAAENG